MRLVLVQENGGIALALSWVGATALILLASVFSSCSTSDSVNRIGALPVVPQSDSFVRVAVIGDFGCNCQAEGEVATLVKSWNPHHILTVGDNNYSSGLATIDDDIGRYFQDFIHPYHGKFGPGADINRFWAVLGNHDWEANGSESHLAYFQFPNNERYYDFIQGPVHFFALDSYPAEPDGTTPGSVQGTWLHEKLGKSTSKWKIIYFHHPPFSSGMHKSTEYMRWPFREWGADAVFSGHDHTYERVMQQGLPYFVNGLGGKGKYPFLDIVPGSEVRFNSDYGAMLIEALSDRIQFRFITRKGLVIDSLSLSKGNLPLVDGVDTVRTLNRF